MNPSNNSTQKRLFQTLALALGSASIVAARAATPDYPPAEFPAAGGWGKKHPAHDPIARHQHAREAEHGPYSILRPVHHQATAHTPLHKCEKALAQPLGRHISTLRSHFFP